MSDEKFEVMIMGIVLIALSIMCLIILIGRIKYGGVKMIPSTPAAYIDHKKLGKLPPPRKTRRVKDRDD